MKIKIYHVHQDTGEETPAGECELDDAIDREDPEYFEALEELETVGRYVCGGGAAAMSVLVRA